MKENRDSSNGSRFLEITRILRDHELVKGMTPVKLRELLEDLGPTYIKIGQIMSSRSDILPRAYCEELTKLRSEAPPMPFSDLIEVIESSYGRSWEEVFKYIENKPLGCASIAQVHRAQLTNGEDVVVKVQRKGIYDIMKRDIGLLHKAVRLLPPVKLKNVLDLDMVLDELWVVTQEEMNFLTEAANMEEFRDSNKNVAFVTSPVLYRQYTTEQVLVMEYIEGYQVDDVPALKNDGYDLDEIAQKMVDNYVKQALDDGFFHADPHPGNLRIRDGKIVYIDMGMMGRLTKHDRELVSDAVKGIAAGDVGQIQDAIIALGEFTGKPNQTKLYMQLTDMMSRYGSMDFGNIDVVDVMTELMQIMEDNHARMPHGFTLLVRGLTQMEGVLTEISPDINIVQIASNRMQQKMFSLDNLESELKHAGLDLYISAKNLVELPTLTAKLLRDYQKGQTRVNLELHASDTLNKQFRSLVRNMVVGLCIASLLISSSIVCTTDMWPKLFGIPFLGAAGYFTALIMSVFVVLRYLIRKHRDKD